MLRFISRTVGLWLLAGALIALVVDGARTIAAAQLEATSLIALWQHVSPQTLDAAAAALRDSALPWLWDPVLLSVLELPAFIGLVVLGSLLLWAGQKSQPPLPELDLR